MFHRTTALIGFIKIYDRRGLVARILLTRYYIWLLLCSCLACSRLPAKIDTSGDCPFLMPINISSGLGCVMMPTTKRVHIHDENQIQVEKSVLAGAMDSIFRLFLFKPEGAIFTQIAERNKKLIDQWKKGKLTYSQFIIEANKIATNCIIEELKKATNQTISGSYLKHYLSNFWHQSKIYDVEDQTLKQKYQKMVDDIVKDYEGQSCVLKDISKRLRVEMKNIADQAEGNASSYADCAKKLYETGAIDGGMSPVLMRRNIETYCHNQKKICDIYEHMLSDPNIALNLVIQSVAQLDRQNQNNLSCFSMQKGEMSTLLALVENENLAFASAVLRMYIIGEKKKKIDTLVQEQKKRLADCADEVMNNLITLELANKSSLKKQVQQTQKKTKKSSQKRSQKEPGASSDDIQSLNQAEQIFEDRPQNISTAEMMNFALHRRVKRWAWPETKIKKIFDLQSEQYNNQSIEEIKKQKCFHEIFKVVDVLKQQDSDDYFFNTYSPKHDRKGKAAKAHMQWGKYTYDGFVEVGMEEKENNQVNIYHLMFKPCAKLTPNMVAVVTSNYDQVELAKDNLLGDYSCSDQDNWTPVGDQLEKINNNYVITFVGSDKSQPTKTLSIQPWKLNN